MVQTLVAKETFKCIAATYVIAVVAGVVQRRVTILIYGIGRSIIYKTPQGLLKMTKTQKQR